MSTARLERAVTVLGLRGAELDTVVNGENWDAPKYLPLFKAAESMGAVLFFHPLPQPSTSVGARVTGLRRHDAAAPAHHVPRPVIVGCHDRR